MVFTAHSLRYAILALAATMTAPVAWAHAHLTSQYPAAKAEVSSAPQALTLNFSEGIEPGFSGATITGPKQEKIKTQPAKRNQQDETQMIIPLDESLNSGSYTVDWYVVSVDGHKTKGQYTFSVK
ncbi:CopC domain-containing protein YobA [Citrobacter amalonaticus]|uniref:Copper resistance protein C n=1 Tax=Citrobacter amalonaticus TaxID=35703 RepID=A0A2S4S206_CITAM|nr:CopC domain-containing protein YobA [Citrobacter amalonaticus]POT59323.1 CopC domain-containing protein YobA [Citrobacter amalonaticus]POT77453.1 CopC domain-containing protein YobA [Citrobacter amalonaticus]POU67905.1 CopC domain-containing protein YobA [Citrobacter amalonaticus]POV07509.1 CopC domain-containing protein YobA [Citrobacter amalonaticus]